MFGNVDLYHLVVIAVFVILSSYGFHVLAFLDIVATSIWHFAWVYMYGIVLIRILKFACVRDWFCVYVCNLLAIERTIFCFFFHIYIAFTPCLSTLLHLVLYLQVVVEMILPCGCYFFSKNGCLNIFQIRNFHNLVDIQDLTCFWFR